MPATRIELAGIQTGLLSHQMGSCTLFFAWSLFQGEASESIAICAFQDKAALPDTLFIRESHNLHWAAEQGVHAECVE